MKKEKLSLVVLAIEIASIVALHSYKSEDTSFTQPAGASVTQINVITPVVAPATTATFNLINFSK